MTRPGSITLLLVEDDEGDALAVRRELAGARDVSFHIERATSLEEARDHLSSTPVDAVLLGLGLPDRHGLELVRSLRSAAPDTPLVILTGASEAKLAADSLRERAQDYLLKTELDALERALLCAIERMHSERERRDIENQRLEVQELESLGVLAAREPLETADAPGGLVLLIDDEEVIRRFAGAALESQGYSVLLAEDGVEGLALFRQHARDISLVLLDLTMPRMGGAEVYAELTRLRPDLPVILTSGYSERTAIASLGGANLYGYLQKPFTSRELLGLCSLGPGRRASRA